MRIGKAKPARSPRRAARPRRGWKARASSPMSVTHADSPVAMTWLGSHGTSAGLLAGLAEGGVARLVLEVPDAARAQGAGGRVDEVGVPDGPAHVRADVHDGRAQRRLDRRRLVGGGGHHLEQLELVLAVVEQPRVLGGEALGLVPGLPLGLELLAEPLRLVGHVRHRLRETISCPPHGCEHRRASRGRDRPRDHRPDARDPRRAWATSPSPSTRSAAPRSTPTGRR